MVDRSACTGCAACAAACPKKAIRMEFAGGFEYPVVRREACVHCGLCEKVCPERSAARKPVHAECYAAFSKDRAARVESSSGGVFSALAGYVLRQQGAVSGAAWSDSWSVRQELISDLSQLSALRKSKYVQSRSEDVYEKIREGLRTGKPFLASGTPCQIAGLKSFLSRDYDTLYCVDVVCHGVAGPEMWESYLQDYHSGRQIRSVSMRSKISGWTGYGFSFEFHYADGTRYVRHNALEPYMIAFANDICLRESCYRCPYRGAHPGDITLADFWGVEKTLPEMDDGLGTSKVFLNTEKGRRLFAAIQDDIVARSAQGTFSTLQPSVKRHAMKERFYRDLHRKGFRHAFRRIVLKLFADKALHRLKNRMGALLGG